MPVLAALARFAPFAALILLAQLRHTDPLLTDAARVFQQGVVRTWVHVRLPLLAPGLVAAACMVFALSVGELGATLLVIPPGLETVTIRMYNYLHYGSSGAVAGLGLVTTVLMLAAGAMAVAAMHGWSRLMRGRPSSHVVGGESG
jgi:iron(III) transport system permease protein